MTSSGARTDEDDELCFTAASEFRSDVSEIALVTALPLSRIGTIIGGQGIRCIDAGGRPIEVNQGYQHFDVD